VTSVAIRAIEDAGRRASDEPAGVPGEGFGRARELSSEPANERAARWDVTKRALARRYSVQQGKDGQRREKDSMKKFTKLLLVGISILALGAVGGPLASAADSHHDGALSHGKHKGQHKGQHKHHKATKADKVKDVAGAQQDAASTQQDAVTPDSPADAQKETADAEKEVQDAETEGDAAEVQDMENDAQQGPNDEQQGQNSDAGDAPDAGQSGPQD